MTHLALTLLSLALFAAPLAAEAQQPATKIYRVAFLSAGSPLSALMGPEPSNPGFRAFVQDLRKFGYVEGQNLVIERRSAEGRFERLPDLAAELVRLKVDVIVASSAAAVRAVKQATTTIPIVMAPGGDPIHYGFVASLARPGGNITGLSSYVDFALDGKSLELLKETLPRLTRVGLVYLTPGEGRSYAEEYKDLEAAARALQVVLLPATADRPSEFADAFATLARARVDAVMVAANPLTYANGRLIAELAAKHRLPAIYGFRENAEAGGLMSHGASIPDIWRRAAYFVDKILRGAKPADLPVEQPTIFELVINLKTAKTLGLTIPPSVLARADEVIE
jgi:putative ABC transport system substrate-binding protein